MEVNGGSSPETDIIIINTLISGCDVGGGGEGGAERADNKPPCDFL